MEPVTHGSRTGGVVKTQRATTSTELKSKIRRRMIEIAEFEEAIARLGDTNRDDWISIMEIRLQTNKTALQTLEAEYKTIEKSSHNLSLIRNPRVPPISITDLVQVASAEKKAWEDVIALTLTHERLVTESIHMEHKLDEKKHKKEREKLRSIKMVEATDNESELQELKNNIEENADKIRELGFESNPMLERAYKAMIAANSAATSYIEIPGIGRWNPSPALISATTASTTVTTSPITVTAAQVKVADIPSDVKAAAKDIQVGMTSDIVATVPTSMTAVIKVDKTRSSVTLCPPQRPYADVKRVEEQEFDIGDIGWFPVLRPSLAASSADIHTEFGYICAKSYPLIIVEKLDDCMLGLIISTSNGNGLSRKSSSISSRSVPVIAQFSTNTTTPDWGQRLYPRQKLRVEGSSDYNPPTGAYVDMLNAIMIPYDSRFEKKGHLVGDDVLPLQQMRLSAVLANSGAGTLGSHSKFWSWFGKWWKQA